MLMALRGQTDFVDEGIDICHLTFVIGHFSHELQVLGDIHLLVEGVIFRQVADTRGGGDGTGVGRPETDEDLHEGGFAGTVGSQQTNDLACWDLQGYVIKHLLRAE